MNLYYAGIGSRETPTFILEIFKKLAIALGELGFILRSGGAKGADQAFESGADIYNYPKEIYLPWKGFEGSESTLILKPGKAYEIGAAFHERWNNLSSGGKKLQARNSHQVLGKDLNTLSDFIVCYTTGGSGAGGTGQAIRIANRYNIPVFDAGSYSNIEDFENDVLNYARSLLNKNENINFNCIKGNFWTEAYSNKYDAICVTTNGIVMNNGLAVMGAGIAKQFKDRFKNIDSLLGNYLNEYGNRCFILGKDLSYKEKDIYVISFPTKHDWKNKSDIALIEKSAQQLIEIKNKYNLNKILLTPPGCGNGGLTTEEVYPILNKYFNEDFYIISK